MSYRRASSAVSNNAGRKHKSSFNELNDDLNVMINAAEANLNATRCKPPQPKRQETISNFSVEDSLNIASSNSTSYYPNMNNSSTMASIPRDYTSTLPQSYSTNVGSSGSSSNINASAGHNRKLSLSDKQEEEYVNILIPVVQTPNNDDDAGSRGGMNSDTDSVVSRGEPVNILSAKSKTGQSLNSLNLLASNKSSMIAKGSLLSLSQIHTDYRSITDRLTDSRNFPQAYKERLKQSAITGSGHHVGNSNSSVSIGGNTPKSSKSSLSVKSSSQSNSLQRLADPA